MMLLLPILLLLFSSCSYRVEKDPVSIQAIDPQTALFPEVQSLILGPKCAKCHGGMVSSYGGVVANLAEITARVQSTDPEFMMPPPGEAALSAEERAALLSWISRGAPEGESSAMPTPHPAPVIPGLNFAYMQQKVFPKCQKCHGAMVTSYERVLENLTEIASRVRSPLEFEQMPPPEKPQLTDEEKNLLLDWIQAGAPKENPIPN